MAKVQTKSTDNKVKYFKPEIFKKILVWIEAGKTVAVTNRNRHVAEIMFDKKTFPIVRPDFEKRLRATFPIPFCGLSNAELIAQERGN